MISSCESWVCRAFSSEGSTAQRHRRESWIGRMVEDRPDRPSPGAAGPTTCESFGGHLPEPASEHDQCTAGEQQHARLTEGVEQVVGSTARRVIERTGVGAAHRVIRRCVGFEVRPERDHLRCMPKALLGRARRGETVHAQEPEGHEGHESHASEPPNERHRTSVTRTNPDPVRGRERLRVLRHTPPIGDRTHVELEPTSAAVAAITARNVMTSAVTTRRSRCAAVRDLRRDRSSAGIRTFWL